MSFLLMRKCCCFASLKTGSIFSGVYTMIFYTIILASGSFHIDAVIGMSVMFPLTIAMVTLAALLVLSSIMLLIGLYADARGLLVPWLILMAITTSFDVSVSIYLLTDVEFNPFAITLFVFDFFFCGLNFYCFWCILSQFYEYRRLSRLEKKARVRRRRIEKLKSALNAEHGFDLESGEEYEESDLEEDFSEDALDFDPEAGEERFLRQRLKRIRRSKQLSLQGIHQNDSRTAGVSDSKRMSRRTISPIPSISTTQSISSPEAVRAALGSPPGSIVTRTSDRDGRGGSGSGSRRSSERLRPSTRTPKVTMTDVNRNKTVVMAASPRTSFVQPSTPLHHIPSGPVSTCRSKMVTSKTLPDDRSRSHRVSPSSSFRAH